MADQTERSPRAVRLTDMEDIGLSLNACVVCGSPDIVTQHVVTVRGRDFAVTVASWCEKPECEEDRRLTVLSVGMLPPDSLAPAIDPDDEALDRWTRARDAARRSEHHFVADCMTEMLAALKAVTQ